MKKLYNVYKIPKNGEPVKIKESVGLITARKEVKMRKDTKDELYGFELKDKKITSKSSLKY